MSLAIEIDDVRAVLLADGWHTVLGDSFNLDSYEYHWGDDGMHGGGDSGICSTGFSCDERDDAGHTHCLYGPLTSVLAVRTKGDDQ